MQEAQELLRKSATHKDSAIENKRERSLWTGLGKEYQTKLSLFRRGQK